MIEFEILRSPDPELLGRHKFFFPRISLGPQSAHLPLRDPSAALVLELAPKGVLLNTRAAYLFNGKRVLGQKMLVPDDQIELGETTFRLVSFEALASRPDSGKPAFQDLPRGPELLECLKRELLFIDYKHPHD